MVMALWAKLPLVMCATEPSAFTVPQMSLCIFQEKWKITIDRELYIQNRPRNTWSQADT